jgi:hypothetical protein
MGISNISRIGGELNKGVVALLILTLSACASSAKRGHDGSAPEDAAPNEIQNTGSTNDGEMYGPFPGMNTAAPSEAAPAVDALPNPDRVVLVFGRGLTHGYAYVGVLRALRELKVPVQAIYATEAGALAAALYFIQPNPNRIDWALLHFTERNLGATTGRFSFHLRSPEDSLDKRLREVFGNRRVEVFADRLHIELQDAKTGEEIEARSGDLWRAVRGALAGANGFDPVDFQGRSVRASPMKISEEYRIARRREKYPVIVIAAGKTPSPLFRKQLEEEQALFISIPLPGIDDLDLKKRNQAVFAGKNAIHRAEREILGRIGRKPEEKGSPE